jgi:DNA-binding transcriptional LysR family regulator
MTSPGLRIRVREAEVPDALEALKQREADVGIMFETSLAPRADDVRWHRRDLVADVLDAVVPVDHPLAARDRIDLADLAAETWVAPLEGWSCDLVFEGACRAVGFSPRVEHRTTDWVAVKSLVAAGLGVALVPRLAQPNPPPGVVIRPLAGEAPARHLFALCHRGAEHGRAVAVVLDALAVAAARTVEPRLAVA